MKKLTTKINELKRKIAKQDARLAVIRSNEIIPPAMGQPPNEWFYREKWQIERTDKLKAELCDLLLERVQELETEVAMFSKEYEVGR